MWQQLKKLVGEQIEISHSSIDKLTGQIIRLQQDFEGRKIIILLPKWQTVDEELAHSEYEDFNTIADLLES